MENDMISFRIKPELKSKLVKEADLQKRSISNMIILLLTKGLEDKEQV